MSFLYAFLYLLFFFFNSPAVPEFYTLSLHDALPIFPAASDAEKPDHPQENREACPHARQVIRTEVGVNGRSEEHTSELQSQSNLVCRLLLEKKKQQSES